MYQFIDFREGDFVCLKHGKEGERQWAKVAEIQVDGYVRLDQEIGGTDTYAWSDVFLTHRPLEVGKVYYEVGDFNIIAWKITEEDIADPESLYGPVVFYKGERWVGEVGEYGGEVRDIGGDYLRGIMSGKFVESELEANQKSTKILAVIFEQKKRELETLKETLNSRKARIEELQEA